MKELPKIGDLLYCPYKGLGYGYSIVVKITTSADEEFGDGRFDKGAEVIVAWPLGSKVERGQRLYNGRYYNVFCLHSYVADLTKIIASLEEP